MYTHLVGVLVICAGAVGEQCTPEPNHHTDVFKQYWDEIGNDNYYFYDSRTFGMDYPTPCKKLPVDNNTPFRDAVNKKT